MRRAWNWIQHIPKKDMDIKVKDSLLRWKKNKITTKLDFFCPYQINVDQILCIINVLFQLQTQNHNQNDENKKKNMFLDSK